MKALLLSLVCCASMVAADPFEGWGKVKWGSTADQIREAYGVSDSLELAAYDIGGDSFAVKFGMEDGALAWVELRPAIGDVVTPVSRPVSGDIRKVMAINAMGIRLSRLIEEKYGPASRNLNQISASSTLFEEWLMDGGNIRLTMDHKYEASQKAVLFRLRLRYERKPKALDKI